MKEKLLADIASGVVTQRPWWRDMLPKIVIGTLIASVFVLSVFIFTYLFFALRIQGVSALLGFGIAGIPFFLSFMPWYLVVADVIAVIGLVQLSKKFSFGWKTPRVYLALLILSAAFVAALVIDRPLNDALYEARTRLPAPMGSLYTNPLPPPTGSGFTHGTILMIDDELSEVSIVDERTGDIVEVSVPERMTQDVRARFEVGETVFVAGPETDGKMRAFGIRKDMRQKRQEFRETRENRR